MVLPAITKKTLSEFKFPNLLYFYINCGREPDVSLAVVISVFMQNQSELWLYLLYRSLISVVCRPTENDFNIHQARGVALSLQISCRIPRMVESV